MNLDEAIDILTMERDAHHSFATDVVGEAEGLGVEALKETKRLRKFKAWFLRRVLPGETT